MANFLAFWPIFARYRSEVYVFFLAKFLVVQLTSFIEMILWPTADLTSRGHPVGPHHGQHAMTRTTLSSAALLVSTLVLGSGCDFIEQLSERSAIVDVFTTSHGTPDELGNMPNRNGEQLIFTNDMGWQVFINDAYVTTSAVTLLACDGERFDIEMYWGALAENMGETADTEVAGLGGVRANSGNYCDVLVAYAPAEDADDALAMGSTVLFTGSAVKGDQHIDFTWRSDVELEIEVDISEVDAGAPFSISRQEHFSKKLTISKSYNHFFDGVDFAEALSQDDIEALIADSLRDGTVAFEGTTAP
jgi:hypothetical protein